MARWVKVGWNPIQKIVLRIENYVPNAAQHLQVKSLGTIGTVQKAIYEPQKLREDAFSLLLKVGAAKRSLNQRGWKYRTKSSKKFLWVADRNERRQSHSNRV